jgi:AcrR family transcriptional regulator
MSPARGRTSADEIVAAGRELLEAGGLDAVTMQAVAGRVGVRAPSLYKRFSGRAALIAAMISSILEELRTSLATAAEDPDPVAGLRSMATRYRSYALAHPRAYALAYTDLPADHRPSAEENARAAAPLLVLTARVVGPDRALEAARLLTAFVHGFISMELAGAFRLGGDVETAYGFGVEVITAALAEGLLPEGSVEVRA